MDKEAYPNNFIRSPLPTYDNNKWKQLAMKIATTARRFGGEYSNDEIIDRLTQKWDYAEKQDFKRWFKYQQKSAAKDNSMVKVAYDFASGQKEERLLELKKKLRSRINSAEKLLTKIMDEDLLEDPQKGIYISRILQKLKEEVSVLRQPQLITARHNRVRKILAKSGFSEGADILEESVQLIRASAEQPLIKVAQDGGISAIMGSLKGEIDTFNYGRHLSTLYQVAESLKQAGRHSEADKIVEVIKKDLSDLDKIHKKLVEVYTSLGSIPTEQAQSQQLAQPAIQRAPRQR